MHRLSRGWGEDPWYSASMRHSMALEPGDSIEVILSMAEVMEGLSRDEASR